MPRDVSRPAASLPLFLKSTLCVRTGGGYLQVKASQLEFFTLTHAAILIISLPSVCLQLTLKTGRTSRCPETPTTWWEPTASRCSSTTFKDEPAGVMLLNVKPWEG